MLLAVRIYVRDEGRVWDTLALGCERGSEREDVGDGDVGTQLAHERQRVARGVHDGLVEGERLGARGKHLVLGCGREGDALGFDLCLPARPRLQRDGVPSCRERAPERDHRKRVAGVAEGAQQDLHAAYAAASSASRRSCCRRSGAVNAVGVTPSVPTPASR